MQNQSCTGSETGVIKQGRGGEWGRTVKHFHLLPGFQKNCEPVYVLVQPSCVLGMKFLILKLHKCVYKQRGHEVTYLFSSVNC